QSILVTDEAAGGGGGDPARAKSTQGTWEQLIVSRRVASRFSYAVCGLLVRRPTHALTNLDDRLLCPRPDRGRRWRRELAFPEREGWPRGPATRCRGACSAPRRTMETR